MKKKYFAILMMGLAVGLAACSNDDEEIAQPEQEQQNDQKGSNEADNNFEEPDNSVPEFEGQYGFNPRGSEEGDLTVTDNAEITRDGMGSICRLVFTNLADAPASAQELFSQYMKLDPDENFRLSRTWTDDRTDTPVLHELYLQQYKGIPVAWGYYYVNYLNGTVASTNGGFININDLDTKPSFSEQKAKEIFAKYLKESADKIEAGSSGIFYEWPGHSLIIAEFPVSKESDQLAPRLVYSLKYSEFSPEGCCLIDAHTGRILQTWTNGAVAAE